MGVCVCMFVYATLQLLQTLLAILVSNDFVIIMRRITGPYHVVVVACYLLFAGDLHVLLHADTYI